MGHCKDQTLKLEEYFPYFVLVNFAQVPEMKKSLNCLKSNKLLDPSPWKCVCDGYLTVP